MNAPQFTSVKIEQGTREWLEWRHTAGNGFLLCDCPAHHGLSYILVDSTKSREIQLADILSGSIACGLKAKIKGKAFRVVGSESRKLADAPGHAPLWERYYELGTDRPIFGDRDRTIHDDVNEISRERRKGYSWFSDTGRRVLAHYEKWAKVHPLGESRN